MYGAPTGQDSAADELLNASTVRPGDEILLLCQQTAIADRAGRRQLSVFRSIGATVRLFRGRLPGIMTIGPSIALVEGHVVRSAELVGTFSALHGALWDQSVGLDALGGDLAGLLLDDHQSQVLSMLCSGVKDETAARRLKVSVRTYRRRVAGIMANLNVTSRLEAGLRISELGLTEILKVVESA
jgi:hypothetical protein